VDTACWVRRIAGDQFQVFAINCAHLGCPVRWFAQSGLYYVSLSRWRVLPRRLTRIWATRARSFRISVQSRKRSADD
jgi:hypothetical protein